jgi:benzodiazapine receptor
MTTVLTPKSERSGMNGLPRLCLAVLPVAAAGTIASLATLPNIPSWYVDLAKPPMTPPNWLFGPAWTLLYSLMAIAFFRVLGHSAKPRDAIRQAAGRLGVIGAFLAQLALNAIWSIAFFGLHNPALGLAVIAALIAAIAATMVRFRRVDRPAFWLLAPYLAWVLFAAYLNCGVWWLNG